ncbi:hypothetical protein BH11ACT4_BH11ACT4_18080 [soil metagenome]
MFGIRRQPGITVSSLLRYPTGSGYSLGLGLEPGLGDNRGRAGCRLRDRALCILHRRFDERGGGCQIGGKFGEYGSQFTGRPLVVIGGYARDAG